MELMDLSYRGRSSLRRPLAERLVSTAAAPPPVSAGDSDALRIFGQHPMHEFRHARRNVRRYAEQVERASPGCDRHLRESVTFQRSRPARN